MGEAREWALDWHSSGGRLSALELLASLQHHGIPTRMLDFSLSPLIALRFAVEDNGAPAGRVFAIDISNRNVTREQAALADPWWWSEPATTDTRWATEPWVWIPPPLEARIVRQQGCFLMGGVPSTRPARNLVEGGKWRPVRAHEVRACMAVPFQLIKYDQAIAAAAGSKLPGCPSKARAFTLAIRQKTEIRQELERSYGYTHRSLFPDAPGFRDYGSSFR